MSFLELLNIIFAIGVIAEVALPAARSLTVLRWGIGSLSGVQWAMLLPSTFYVTQGVKGMLLKSSDEGATWRLMDTIDYKPQEEGLSQRTLYRRVRHWVENGFAVFTISGVDKLWRFRDPDDPTNGYVAPEGKFEVSWFGGGGLWRLLKMIHRIPRVGTNILGSAVTNPLFLPSWVNHDPADQSLRLSPANPDTTDVHVTADTLPAPNGSLNDPAGSYRLKVSFLQTASGALKGGDVKTPVVYAVQEIRKAKVEQVGISKGDLAADCARVTWELNRGLRDCRMTFRIKNDAGQWDFLRGNELVLLDVAKLLGNDDGTITPDPVVTWSSQCGGFITKIVWLRDLEWNGSKGWVDITTRGWEFRLRKKPARALPPFSGWDAREACELVLHQAGVLSDYVDLSAMDYGVWILQGTAATVEGKGKIGFSYTEHDSVIVVMDEILTSVGWAWYQGPDMVIRLRSILATKPDSTYTLDETNYDPDVDCLTELSLGIDLEDLFNIVEVDSRQIDGTTKTAIETDPKSIYGDYATDPNYVGDDWWDVHRGPAGIDPDTMARGRLIGIGAFNQVVSWRTDLQLAVAPDTLVTVNVEQDAIPAGTKFQVMKVQGSAELTETEIRAGMNFLMGRPVTPVAS